MADSRRDALALAWRLTYQGNFSLSKRWRMLGALIFCIFPRVLMELSSAKYVHHPTNDSEVGQADFYAEILRKNMRNGQSGKTAKHSQTFRNRKILA